MYIKEKSEIEIKSEFGNIFIVLCLMYNCFKEY